MISDDDKIKGKPPTKENSYWIDWAKESLKNNLVLSNDILRQLLTLNVALLGSSVIFLDQKMLPSPFWLLTVLAFFLSLVIAFFGVLPYEANLDIRVPAKIEQHKKDALWHKRIFLWISAGFTALGFTFAITGILCK